MLVIAHVSDPHFDGGERAAGRAARVMAYLAGLPHPVDLVLATGDIADHGRPDEYAQAREWLEASPYPVLACPGNHDARDAFRSELLAGLGAPDAASGDAPVNQAREVDGALFAVCDSSIPGRDDGVLTDETLTWLDGVLSEGDGPAFVCFHHPPALLEIPAADGIRQFGAERLAALLTRHPRVVAVLCGHAHTAAATTFAGRPLLVAPGVVSTVNLPWESDGFLNFDHPAGVAFHILGEDNRLTTHFRFVQ